MLNDFRLLDQSWIDRQSDRVQPKLPIFVSVINGKKTTKANLFDISLTGMCILIDKNTVEESDHLMDSTLQVLLTLPSSRTTCKITGKVVQRRSIGNNLLRLGMNISMNNKDHSIVAHYLSERKREILDELFINFTSLLNYRETKDQYF
jgi:c-di-GMP-binding flagellar brake protein YcgR